MSTKAKCFGVLGSWTVITSTEATVPARENNMLKSSSVVARDRFPTNNIVPIFFPSFFGELAKSGLYNFAAILVLGKAAVSEAQDKGLLFIIVAQKD
jgi:hypothetical protein